MRILIVSDVSSHMRGGVPAETRSLIRGLGESGHLVALASDAPLEGAEEAQHLPITIPAGPSISDEVGRAINSFRPDFIHVICMSSVGVARLATLLRPHRWALTVHSIPPHERKLARWHDHENVHYGMRAVRFLANSLAWRRVFRSGMVPQIIVHSEYVEDIVVTYGGREVMLIPLPFEAGSPTVADDSSDTEAPLLLSVGGLAHTKGQHDVLKAMPALLSHFPNLRYQAIGEIRDHSYLAYLHALARRLKVDAHVDITPDLPRAEKDAALSRCSVYVQPSHEEGFCLAYAEAAAVVPRLVGTNTGAIAAMSRSDEGARVVPVRQPKAIAAAVVELLGARLPADHMAERARRLSESFSLAGYIKAHEALYARPPLAPRSAPVSLGASPSSQFAEP
jgi:glycosyltransferase involved in cell wall biosynthesis